VRAEPNSAAAGTARFIVRVHEDSLRRLPPSAVASSRASGEGLTLRHPGRALCLCCAGALTRQAAFALGLDHPLCDTRSAAVHIGAKRLA